MKPFSTAEPDVRLVDVDRTALARPEGAPFPVAPDEGAAPRRRYRFRKPDMADGAAIWALVRDTGVLDVNSAYSYLMLGSYFAETCVVAEKDEVIVGFVSGFKPPEKPDTVFVWQVAVAGSEQGRGLGKRLLRRLLAGRACRDVRFIETTVTPSNTASMRLFQSMARELDTVCVIENGFDESLFPEAGAHESERLFRIGPIRH